MAQSGFNDAVKYHLTGMYQDWFLDYASYVILERAVPAIEDGLKPVQRRILHAMKTVDDGKYNKVANIVGQTMQYHPHGDASIGDALVQLGQKDLLIDCQGNWGNILTGDGAAAPRYIEARLSKFALETVFNAKTTEWMKSYDGRKNEPIHLPVKFPLLLAQGVEGIAVGLNSKILPHNFNELCDASLAYLRNDEFALYPDFPTGGVIDVTRYNDGERGGAVKIRARITKADDNKTLVITEIPFGTTTSKIIETILKANQKGKIKIKKIDDFTADTARIVVQLAPGSSSDKAIDALYAFTDCEVNISPNCCVVENRKPIFTTVSNLLKLSCDNTKALLKWELEIEKAELEEKYFYTSLEKIFIENRIYKQEGYENAPNKEKLIEFVDNALTPFKHLLIREVRTEDIEKLFEIRMIRITKFDSKKADELMKDLEKKIKACIKNLNHLTDYTIAWFEMLKAKYGEAYPRRTEVRNFGAINVKAVVENNEKLYINREEGFVGTGLKKDEFLFNCSDIDDLIVFHKDGRYKVMKVAEKLFVGTDILHIAVFKRGDDRTVYNVVYRDGKNGAPHYVKRFAVKGITRDKEYDLTQGKPGSKVRYFSPNPNGEAEIIKVTLVLFNKKQKTVDYDFAELAVKGRDARGNLLTKYEVKEVKKGGEGVSTLNARDIWYDDTVRRLNADKRGLHLGAFEGDDKILQIFSNGEFKISGFDLNTHFDDDMVEIRKFDPEEVFSVVYIEGETQKMYLKRFTIEAETKLNSRVSFIGEHPEAKYLGMSTDDLPRLLLSYKVSEAGNSFPDDEVNVEEFIGVKSYKAKGKRLSTREIDSFNFLEPYQPEPSKEETEAPDSAEGSNDTDAAEEPENEEKKVVNPADVPMEIVKPQGDGVQMDLFGNDME